MKNPMLAAKADSVADVTFPKLASAKLDGVRATIQNGVVLSRTLKPIPNLYVQQLFGKKKLEGFDGELIVGPANAPDVCRATTSGVMSKEGKPCVSFRVFDLLHDSANFAERHTRLMTRVEELSTSAVEIVNHRYLGSAEELEAYESDILAAGFEGVMLRSLEGLYKHGRATLKEQSLIKLKRFEDGEAVVLSCYEQQRNNNAATLDERGYTKRSSHKANKKGKGTLGGFRVKDVKTGIEFDIGTGFDDELRANLWVVWRAFGGDHHQGLCGKIVKYKFFPTGSKDKPRFPVFVSFRDPIDM